MFYYEQKKENIKLCISFNQEIQKLWKEHLMGITDTHWQTLSGTFSLILICLVIQKNWASIWVSVVLCFCVSVMHKCQALRLVNVVHAGYIDGLLLVRISWLSEHLLRPGWRQCVQYKRTVYPVQVYSYITGPSKLCGPPFLAERL